MRAIYHIFIIALTWGRSFDDHIAHFHLHVVTCTKYSHAPIFSPFFGITPASMSL